MESRARPTASDPPTWRRKGTVYLVAVDAMTFDVILPLAESGTLPRFARLLAEGCHGLLSSAGLESSGAIWTTIATGRHYRDHGIAALDYYRFLGLRVSRRITHVLNKLGAKGIVRALRNCGVLKQCLFDSQHLRAKTFWDIAGEGGARIGVANWINTWPAYPVNGFIASDRLQPWRLAIMGRERPKTNHLTFPEALAEELRPLLMSPEQVPLELLSRYVSAPENELAEMLNCEFDRRGLESEMRFALSSDFSGARVFEHCLDAFAPLDLAVAFFWAMDKVQHAGFRYMPLLADAGVSEAERERFGNVVPESYRFVDGLIGRLMSRMGPDDTIFVLSDHGFVFEPKRGTYGHKRARPPGVFMACGPEFRRGCELKDATIYDVAPTVLRVCGLRPAQDMPGRCLDGSLTPEFLRENPPLPPVATYGSRTSGIEDAGEAAAEPQGR